MLVFRPINIRIRSLQLKSRVSINLEVSLIEIILSVLIFAICGVIMLNCFAAARFTQVKANDVTKAGIKVQTAIELVKSSKNQNEMKVLLSSIFSENYYDNISGNIIYVNYYDKNWNKISKGENEYSVKALISDHSVISGEMYDIYVIVDKMKPYPFIGKKDETESIYSVKTKKFFSSLNSGAVK